MKIKAVRTYRDKHTKEIFDAGTERDVADERGLELIRAGLAEQAKDPEGQAIPAESNNAPKGKPRSKNKG